MTLNSFNKIAPYYDRLAAFVFGKSIIESQRFYLDKIPVDSNVLVIGGGTGFWLKELQSNNPQCKIWFIDASTEMLKRAKENATENVVFIHGTEEAIPSVEFDVVITYFYLDMFDEKKLKRVLNHINSFLVGGGLWIVSDFVNIKFWNRLLLFLMYRFFNLVGAIDIKRLSDWQKSISDLMFGRLQQQFFFGEFILSCVYRKPFLGY